MDDSRIEEIYGRLTAVKKELADALRATGGQTASEYSFATHDGGRVSLAELFGDKDDLIAVHNMGERCAYCTLWADGLNGLVDQLRSRAAFVVCSPDSVETQRAIKASRNWRFDMVSTDGNGFNKAMGFEAEDGSPWPGFTTFHRGADGAVTRVARSFFGPGDDYCAVWPMFDLLQDGPNGWEPS